MILLMLIQKPVIFVVVSNILRKYLSLFMHNAMILSLIFVWHETAHETNCLNFIRSCVFFLKGYKNRLKYIQKVKLQKY